MNLGPDCNWWQPGDVAPFITPQAYQFLGAMHDAGFAVFTAPAGMVGAMTDLRCVGIINRGMGRRWEVFFNEGHEQVGALFTTSLANAPLAAASWLEGSEIEEAMRHLEASETSPSSFKQDYRSIFDKLGYPLTEGSGTPPELIASTEKGLGVKLPPSLRDYYLVAGRERRFNQCHNRLLSPRKWSINKEHLLFMQENQSVLWWSLSLRNLKSGDPPVYRGANEESISWCHEHRRCSVFLAVMLHYNAVSGGFPCCARADAPEETEYRFEKHGWIRRGEVNSLIAYSRQDEVVCLMPPGDLPFMQQWSVLAGTKSKARLNALAKEIGVTFS